ncbi:hypothetical protein ABVK25_010879 [Lepraria finkii]|uniref:Uncharacterized protein n=1 Tax=Lepraria finkii TaxID=1340010 RepID=A0ABR4AUQ6_9LECA
MLFSNLIPKSIGNSISELLERTTTFYYSDTNAPLEESYTAQIQGIEAFVGSQMIQAIEGLLKPKALAKSSQDQLIGLTILLFGELVTVGYSNTKMTAWDQTSESQKSARRFCEARTQLLRVLIHYLVKIAGQLYNPPQKLCENQLLKQLSSGLADKGGFDWAMPLENRRPELIPNNSAQAGEEEKQPILKLNLNSSERTVEANNAQLPSLFLPMEAKSVSTDHLFWDSTTEVIQTMQLRQQNPFQRPSEAYCTSCNTVLCPDGVCQSCLEITSNLTLPQTTALHYNTQVRVQHANR